MTYFDSGIGVGRVVLLVAVIAIALGFEFVNGFHDTANAVATVIYTRTLRPWYAVIWSGFCNFCGVYLGGIAVAMSIIKLLPVELLASSGSGAGLAMVLALLIAAIAWNLGTWYFGLPASSSHTLIGAIVGVGLANSLGAGHVFGSGINWHKVQEVGLSLVVSPIFGMALAGLLLVALKKVLVSKVLHEPADPEKVPPWWVRVVLVGTCSGVSFAHGSNDGQKGVGLVDADPDRRPSGRLRVESRVRHHPGPARRRGGRRHGGAHARRLRRRRTAHARFDRSCGDDRVAREQGRFGSRVIMRPSMESTRCSMSHPRSDGTCARGSCASTRTWLRSRRRPRASLPRRPTR